MKKSKLIHWRRGALGLIQSGCAVSVLVAALTVGSVADVRAIDAGILARGPAIQALHVPSVVASGQALRLNAVAPAQRL